MAYSTISIITLVYRKLDGLFDLFDARVCFLAPRDAYLKVILYPKSDEMIEYIRENNH